MKTEIHCDTKGIPDLRRMCKNTFFKTNVHTTFEHTKQHILNFLDEKQKALEGTEDEYNVEKFSATIDEITNHLGLTKQTVYKYLRKLEQEPNTRLFVGTVSTAKKHWGFPKTSSLAGNTLIYSSVQ